MAVFDSPQDLADWAGTTLSNVQSSISRHKIGKHKGYTFIRVYLNKEDMYE